MGSYRIILVCKKSDIVCIFPKKTFAQTIVHFADIAPNYAGTLMAITNTFATLPGIIMPIFVGAVTHGNVC